MRTDVERANLRPDPNAPKPNKRFLAAVIRNVDGHNASVLRAQAQGANSAREERRGEGGRAAMAASRLFGGAMKGVGRNGASSSRPTAGRASGSGRGDSREEGYGVSRIDDERRHADGKGERRHRDRDDSDYSRQDRHSGRDRPNDDERWESRSWKDVDERERERTSRRIYDEDFKREKRSRRDDDERDDRSSRRHQTRSRSRSKEQRRDSSRGREIEERKSDSRRDYDTDPRRRSESPRPSKGAKRESKSSRSSRYDDSKERGKEKDSGLYGRNEDSSRSPPRSGQTSRQPDDLSREKRTQRENRYERPKPPTPPPPPDVPPPPSPDSTPPPIYRPSKMDKYFNEDYDPRLDMSEVPREGPVMDVGWDNMLAVLKERGHKVRFCSNSDTQISTDM